MSESLARENAELRLRLEQLEGELSEAYDYINSDLDAASEASHLEAFQAVAKELGIRPDAVGDVWRLGEFEVGDGEPDPGKMKEHFESFLKARQYLRGGNSQAGPKLAMPPDPGRPGAPAKDTGRPVVTRDQLNDPDWTAANEKLLASGEWSLRENDWAYEE